MLEEKSLSSPSEYVALTAYTYVTLFSTSISLYELLPNPAVSETPSL